MFKDRAVLDCLTTADLLDSIVDLFVKGTMGRMGCPNFPIVRHFRFVYINGLESRQNSSTG